MLGAAVWSTRIRSAGDGETVIDINKEIAELRGWKPPTSVTSYHADWLSPDGERHECPPLFDTDPAAAMELLDDMEEVKIYRDPQGAEVIWIGRSHGTAKTLTEAVAAAWLAARKGEKSGD